MCPFSLWGKKKGATQQSNVVSGTFLHSDVACKMGQNFEEKATQPTGSSVYSAMVASATMPMIENNVASDGAVWDCSRPEPQVEQGDEPLCQRQPPLVEAEGESVKQKPNDKPPIGEIYW